MITSVTILSIAILIFSIIVHEVAHGWMADYLGDPTAKLQGRLTLNPIPHIDLMGSIILPTILVISGSPILFGWAKPVPYNPYNLRGKFAELKVAAVGPLSNIILAIIFGILFRAGIFPQIQDLLYYGVIINCVLAVFNLVPIPPLDGSKILFELLPARFREIRQTMERYGFALVIAFVIFGWPLIAPIIYLLVDLITGGVSIG